MSATDQELLELFVQGHSQDAFTVLVERHLNLVYCAAFRQVRSHFLAEEVAQTVFTDLSRHAARLKANTILSAWLYEVTRRSSVDVIRAESRRQAREQTAVDLNTMNTPSDTWIQVEPLLDEAMNHLDELERSAILLRFFENKSLREVGTALGTTEEAARKRISRALTRLRDFLSGHGIQIAEAGLILLVSTQAVQSAPTGLASTISTKILGIITLSTVAAQTTLHMIQFKTISAVVVTALLVGTGTYFSQKSGTDKLRADLQSTRDEREQLAKERDSARSESKRRESEIEQARLDKTELLRLRGEVGQLRVQLNLANQKTAAKSNPPANSKPAGHLPGSYIPKTELKFVGYATPEAALESMAWATLMGTYEQTKEGMAPALLTEDRNENEEKQRHEQQKMALMPLFKGVQVLAKKVISEDRIELKMKTDFDPAIKNLAPNIKEYMVQSMIKVGDAWKVDSDPREHDSTWDTQGQVLNY